ncbi:DUF4348 domain-containing protein [Mucilaginibacter sp. JRF]|uniref:DUF4348 domain-containing protein n=1 Tax=Mucilaginibacter sp. JRF TaxID=2780088 RepID=UPI0018802FC4|nr:DUF4348 domain-containing protein [Mucilaginibacter sp. JRF]MBE9585693.1 DUF4348 domain-containing protein [Mucilaginibacter sp. JRF]
MFTADSKTYIDEDFDLFFKKFKTQSSTQLSRIVFPLKSVYISHDEETVEHTNRSDWKFSNFDTIKKLITKKSKVSNDRVDVVLAIEDTGVHVIYHFEKRKGLWWLIKTTDGST